MTPLRLIRSTSDQNWKTTTFSGCNEHYEEIPYLKISFPEGYSTFQKVDALTDAIKIIIQSYTDFLRS